MAGREGQPQVSLQKLDLKGSGQIKITKENELDNTGGKNLEHVRADVKITAGKWYFEVKLTTNGKIHIGWCNSRCSMPLNTSSAIGHTDDGWTYDGSSQYAFHGNNSGTRYGDYWNVNDVVGCILDCEEKTISYYRNGTDMGVAFTGVAAGDGLYPCVSLQKGQKVSVNFGKSPFKFNVTEVFPDIHGLHISITKEQQQALEKMFEKYKSVGIQLSESGETDDVIKGQGLLQYGQDLGMVDEKDPILIVVAWKLNLLASHRKVWEYSREGFVNGWALIGCWNLETMKKKVKPWCDEAKSAKFKPFYLYVFDYLREEKTVLSMEEALTVWDMLGFNKKWKLMARWCEFVKEKKAITKDTWKLFLAFTEQFPNDLTAFQDDGCWPVLIDEFVEYVQQKEKK